MPPTSPANTALILVVFALLIGAIVGAWAGVIVRLALNLPVLPREKPRVVPWGGKSVVAAVLAWLAIVVFVPEAYRVLEGDAAKPKAERPALTPGEMMTLSALENAAVLLLIPALLAATSGASWRDFGVRLAGFGRQVFRGAVTYPLVAPLVFGVMMLSVLYFGKTPHPLESAIQLDKTPGMALILVLASVVFAPFAEELIFRGVLLGWLTKFALGIRKPQAGEIIELGELIPSAGATGPTAGVFDLPETPTELAVEQAPSGRAESGLALEAVNPHAPPGSPAEPARSSSQVVPLALANVAVSIIFAGLHAAVWPTPIPLFFLSLALGLLYQQTGSIIGPVVLHMLFNGVSTLIMFLALAGTPPPPAPAGKPKPANPVPPPARIVDDEASGEARFRAIPRNRRTPRIWA